MIYRARIQKSEFRSQKIEVRCPTSDVKKFRMEERFLEARMNQYRQDFPIFNHPIHGRAYCYLDNAATTQKPASVIQRVCDFYTHEYATVSRGIYELSHLATVAYEETRQTVQKFLNASSVSEIIFTKGTTESINLVASSYAGHLLKAGDEIIVTEIEHHANFVPWQQLCKEKGFVLKIIPALDNGELDLDQFQQLLSPKTKLVCVGHVSNVLGTIHPIQMIIQLAHQKGARVLIDGAQGVAHLPVDVQALDCDFYCFSGHKIFGPTGVGVLYAKRALLDQMKPYQYGGDMIELVSLSETIFLEPPKKFEAGTPPIVQVIGLKPAIDYVQKIGLTEIARYEEDLLTYATDQLQKMKGVHIIGTSQHKSAIISFVMDDIHPHDVGTVLGDLGVAVRVGHHCSQITMKRYGLIATVRASFCFYNTKAEIDQLIAGLIKAKELLL